VLYFKEENRMNKPPFSYSKAVKAAIISNQIESYLPVKDKIVLKKVKYYLETRTEVS